VFTEPPIWEETVRRQFDGGGTPCASVDTMSDAFVVLLVVLVLVGFVAVVAALSSDVTIRFDWRTDTAVALGLAPDPTHCGVDRESVADVIDLLQWELEVSVA
jgi:hypothetical protein